MIDRRFFATMSNFSRVLFCHGCVLLVALLFSSCANADDTTDQWVIDFDISAAAASNGGNYLLAFGKPVGSDDKTPQKMLLFDLDRRKLLRQTEIERPKYFGIDIKRIFLVPQDGKSLKVLSRRSFAEVASVELKEEVLGMTLVNRRRVGLLLDKGRINAMTYFDRRTLERNKLLEVHEDFVGILHDYPHNDSFYRTRTELKNRVSDEHVCVVETPFLPPFSTWKNPAPLIYPQVDRGGRRRLLESYPHLGVVSGRADSLQWGTAREAAESIDSWGWRRERKGGNDDFVLIRHTGNLSRPEETWSISRTAENNLNSWFQCLVFRKDEVVFISNQVLTYIPKKPLTSEQLRLERDSVPVFDTTSSAKIQLLSSGGVGKKTWTSLSESPHIWIDETTGILTVDTPGLWAEHLAVASDRKKSGFRTFSITKSRTEFKRIIGKSVPRDKSPFCVPVKFRVEDSKLQRAEASIFLLVLAPNSDYDMARTVAPVIKGIGNMIGSTLKTPKKPTKPTRTLAAKALDGRIAKAQAKAEEIQTQLKRILSLVLEIRKLEGADK
jgi:hypothetical protein